MTPAQLEQTILSQYANSPTLLALIQEYNANVDPSADIDSFFYNIWNIDTASGAGLNLLGRIIDVSRIVQIPNTTGFFGFSQQTGSVGFGQGVLYDGSTSTQGQYELSDDAYRALILLKAAVNIGNCAIPTLNKILGQLFSAQVTGSISGTTLIISAVASGVVSIGQSVTGTGVTAGTVITGGAGTTWTVNTAQAVLTRSLTLSRGAAWIANLFYMHMQIRCAFLLQPYEIAILNYGGVFPIPTGVGYSIWEYTPGQTFGFAQQHTAGATDVVGFGQGIFYNGGIA